MMLTIYSTAGCHLCEQAEKVLMDVAPHLTFTVEVEVIDIAESDELIDRYGHRIPVFIINGQQLAWPFDQQQLRDFLSN